MIKNIAEHALRGYVPPENKPNGSKGYGVKLCWNDIPEILKLLAQGHSQKEVAVIFGVHQSVICRIKNNKKWHRGPKED